MWLAKCQNIRSRFKTESGATTVEFALSALFLFNLMFGMVDFTRWLFAINSAVEATRAGARVAAVCSPDATGIKGSMLPWLPPGATSGMIVVSYPAGMVRVALSNVPFTPVTTWILPSSIALPSFATTLPRESLATTPSVGQTNPDC
jgi:TadE-like protein